MKPHLPILALALLLCFGAHSTTPGGKAIARHDTAYCLEIEGRVLNADIDGGSCKVEVMLGGKVIDSVILKSHKKKFRFLFKKNRHYTIRISKEGFAGKSVCVHTDMMGYEGELFEFFFETSLLPAKEATVSQLTVATIYFDDRKRCFYYLRAGMSTAEKPSCVFASI